MQEYREQNAILLEERQKFSSRAKNDTWDMLHMGLVFREVWVREKHLWESLTCKLNIRICKN